LVRCQVACFSFRWHHHMEVCHSYHPPPTTAMRCSLHPREKLALLCQEHAAAQDTCKQAQEREVIQGILESIARFEDEQKKQPQPTLWR